MSVLVSILLLELRKMRFLRLESEAVHVQLKTKVNNKQIQHHKIPNQTPN